MKLPHKKLWKLLNDATWLSDHEKRRLIGIDRLLRKADRKDTTK